MTVLFLLVAFVFFFVASLLAALLVRAHGREDVLAAALKNANAHRSEYERRARAPDLWAARNRGEVPDDFDNSSCGVCTHIEGDHVNDTCYSCVRVGLKFPCEGFVNR